VTKTTSNSPSITYDWLLSILKRSWEFAQERVYLWREKRSFAIERKDAERQIAFGKSFDKSEYDKWCEIIKINDQHEIFTELIERLLTAVQSNPNPGERKRVIKIAVDLIPEGGKLGWRLIFEDPDFNFPRNFANERITFPALVEVDVRDVEKQLWELVREDNTIPANEVPVALNMSPNSNAYRAVKVKLEERDWVWKRRRRDGKLEGIVVAPPRKLPG
jgi:hypothetical protein